MSQTFEYELNIVASHTYTATNDWAMNYDDERPRCSTPPMPPHKARRGTKVAAQGCHSTAYEDLFVTLADAKTCLGISHKSAAIIRQRLVM
jgi:hypothetical protein